MEKKPKKKTVASGSKAPSDYQSRQTEGKTSAADNKFQKQIGKAKDTQRKG